ncbi:hypothetical protein EJ110_NYTH46451 [Nymphaea thermarum]|nr:hypothetical protein EJ110_NYTH46451 [Nymphaea thermarum]
MRFLHREVKNAALGALHPLLNPQGSMPSAPWESRRQFTPPFEAHETGPSDLGALGGAAGDFSGPLPSGGRFSQMSTSILLLQVGRENPPKKPPHPD